MKDLELKEILRQNLKITVIGLSPDGTKPSHQIPVYMKNYGYDVVGVYPKGTVTDGIPLFPKLENVPEAFLKMINVFRRSENIPEVVEDILRLGKTKVLWLQLGIMHPAAEEKARQAGLQVISDRCLLVEHRRLLGQA